MKATRTHCQHGHRWDADSPCVPCADRLSELEEIVKAGGYPNSRSGSRGSVHGSTDLYRAYGANDELLYVGISLSGPTRLAQHRNEAPWWSEVVRVSIERCATREEAVARERAVISLDNPLYNRAGVPADAAAGFVGVSA